MVSNRRNLEMFEYLAKLCNKKELVELAVSYSLASMNLQKTKMYHNKNFFCSTTTYHYPFYLQDDPTINYLKIFFDSLSFDMFCLCYQGKTFPYTNDNLSEKLDSKNLGKYLLYIMVQRYPCFFSLLISANLFSIF
eukprot:TRINITY_DN3559_c0_g1_i1.p1 TRINITY_DN3559_c0_g1~~TRINITY_DN3559_c0_g1_i1.p1  ORF type:complete len:136 (-),score=13.07 TRINITY_DN3559_c0_g1_i1:53-460(-)